MPLDEIKFIQSEFGSAHSKIKLDANKIRINSAGSPEGNAEGLRQLVSLYSDFRSLLQDYTDLLKKDLEHIRTAGETLKAQDQTSGGQFNNK